MLYHKDAVSLIYKPLYDFHKHFYVCKVKACRRLVHNIKRFSGGNAGKFVCKLYALCFTAGKSKRILSKLNISKTNRFERFKFSRNMRN